MTLNTVTLTWNLTDLVQSGESATLAIAPTAQLVDATDGFVEVEVPRPVRFTGGTGQLAGIVPNDSPNVLPQGAGYTITVTADSGQMIYGPTTVQINYANGASQKLSSLSPAQSVATMAGYLQGSYPGGAPGAAEWLSGDGTWTAPTAAQVGADASGAAAAAQTAAEAYGAAHTLGVAATTGEAGFTVVNGTPTILSWTAPSDGQPHRVLVVADQQVTSAETGGAVTWTFTSPAGVVQSPTLFATSQGAGNRHTFDAAIVQPGSTVTVQQSAALTGGAATIWAELLAL